MVFSRVPEPGKVKSRMMPLLGPEGAARLQERLTRRAVSTAVTAGASSVELWCTPTISHSYCTALEKAFDLRLRLQRGADLGERMAAAFDLVLTEVSAAVLIGSDSPDLAKEDLQAALAVLQNGQEAVLGPAADGGYVLIGLRCPIPELFRDMPWGTSAVLGLTRERLARSGKSWHELPVRHDLDRPEDLALFPEFHRGPSQSAS